MPKELTAGAYEKLITEGLSAVLDRSSETGYFTDQRRLDPEESHVLLARHIQDLLLRCLRTYPEDGRIDRQVALCNAVLRVLQESAPDAFDGPSESVPASPQELLAYLQRAATPGVGQSAFARPQIPLASSALLTNGSGEPTIGSEINRELASADRADLLCAFIRWHGVRMLREPINDLRRRGGAFRIITTTYMGVTERRALDFLADLGAEIKVSYETRTTRLHAKAWLFHRGTGYSTGFVGSSNLSHSALTSGLEWNVRVSAIAIPDVFAKSQATFDSYWEDSSFVPYDPEEFQAALGDATTTSTPFFVALDVRPYPFQQEILERLDVERKRHQRWRNLVVAATGTGKTVMAALDYRRLAQELPSARLLYVAHRKEILEQSLRTFRHVMRDGAFGELYVDGRRPETWSHVFASIQSLTARDVVAIPASHFDIVVVDEFHHAAAPSYRALLEHLAPRVLVGLTATPERADGVDVTEWFGGRIAAELRLWEAIQRGLLCPFQYFGVHDDVDLSRLHWRRGGYEVGELEGVYTGNDARVLKILQVVHDRIGDVRAMCALGFCVSVAHANYMAARFVAAGIPAVAVSAGTPMEERENALRRLRSREINVVFAVDLFNEGVDVPEIDTVLFLRPTESVTVFLQQLGRGLRHAEGKACLTVLDFIGRQHERFRYDVRYRALVEPCHGGIAKQVEEGFPFLPAGCEVVLDRVASELILENIKRSLRLNRDALVADLREVGETTLAGFLASRRQWQLRDVYRRLGQCWDALRSEAGLPALGEGPDNEALQRALGRMLHIEDNERSATYRSVLERATPPVDADLSERERRLLHMLHFDLWGLRSEHTLSAGLAALWGQPRIRGELVELFDALDQGATHLVTPLDSKSDEPLWIHGRYSRDEALAALGYIEPGRAPAMREGLVYFEETKTLILFVTLRKAMTDYSPTTRYRDYVVAPDLFHWESQTATGADSRRGRLYREHAKMQVRVLLFMRLDRRDEHVTEPYWFLGPVTYVSHESERPMKVIWRLHTPMPTDLFEEALVAAG
jgi:superfamily II DNA or RNA helicase/HKD family nuclease